jgi:hypothetical protein
MGQPDVGTKGDDDQTDDNCDKGNLRIAIASPPRAGFACCEAELTGA